MHTVVLVVAAVAPQVIACGEAEPQHFCLSSSSDFEEVFAQGIDAILTPATPSSAFGLGEMADADPVQMYLNDVFTVTVNMAKLASAFGHVNC